MHERKVSCYIRHQDADSGQQNRRIHSHEEQDTESRDDPKDNRIDNILIFDVCTAYHIDYRTYEMSFPSVYHVYSWVCYEQLERKDITGSMRRFLLGYLTLAESAIYQNTKKGKLANIPAKKEAVEIVAKCFGLSNVSIFNHKRLAESILKINDISCELIPYILNERMRINTQQIISLGSKSKVEIKELAYEIRNISDKEEIRFADLNKKLVQDKHMNQRNKKKIQSNIPEIRKMPEYDPDAELTSLSLTLPVWINSINRVYESNIDESSIKARNDLYDILCQLDSSTELLKKHLENSIK